jgi:hypothetical protein
MPVIQGGGVVYDQGAAMRESADSLTKALQNLQLIKQNQRKLDQEGLEAAYQAFQMVQASSGLPMQMFMGTEMAKPLLDNIFEMTSRVTGRAMDGNTAKQVSNMLYEYSTNPNNYTKGTWAEFLLTRMGGSSTAEKTEPPRSEEKVDPSNLGKKSDSNLFLTRNDDKREGEVVLGIILPPL